MTKEVQFRRGSSEDHIAVGAGFTGAVAEVTVDTTNNTLRVHDGTTKGGHELVGVAATQHIINKDVVAIGLTVSGISTFGGSVSANQGLSVIGGLDVTYGATLDQLNVTGVSTFQDNVNVTGNLEVDANLAVDANTLFVNAANNRIGIGTDSPAYQVEIENTGANALLVLDRTDGAACFIEGQLTRSAFGSVGATPLALAYNSLAVVTIGAGGSIRVNPDGDGFTFPTTDGSANQVLKTDGEGNLSFTSITSSIQTLTSGTSATYTPPANLLTALVIATGAGAGGGGADGTDTGSASGGSGGAAGGTAIRVYNAAEMGASATYTIGAGTAGGSNTGGDSTTGGSTSFTPAGTGTALTANGGAAGQGTPTSGNAVHPATVGGTASGGNINITGGDGDGAATADVAEIAQGGTGGGSFWGSGGGGGVAAGSGSDPGDAGHAYGSGGGGAATHDTTTGNVGGAGAGGVIFVLEFTAG